MGISLEKISSQSFKISFTFFVLMLAMNVFTIVYYICGLFTDMIELVLVILYSTTVFYTIPQLFVKCIPKEKEKYLRYLVVCLTLSIAAIIFSFFGLINIFLIADEETYEIYHMSCGGVTAVLLFINVFYQLLFIRIAKRSNESELQPIGDEEKDVNMEKEHDKQNVVYQIEDDGNADLEVPSYKEDDSLL